MPNQRFASERTPPPADPDVPARLHGAHSAGVRPRALGARDTHILRDVLGATLRLGLLGVLAGGLLAVAAQLVGSMNGIDVSVLQRRGLLFGQLSTVDALVLAVAVVVVLVLLAVPVPLRRALGIAPMTVMRD